MLQLGRSFGWQLKANFGTFAGSNLCGREAAERRRSSHGRGSLGFRLRRRSLDDCALIRAQVLLTLLHQGAGVFLAQAHRLQ